MYRGFTKVVNFLCISSKYANFTNGKVYRGEAHSRVVGMKSGRRYSNYRIIDDDGDGYGIDQEDIGKLFKVNVEDV